MNKKIVAIVLVVGATLVSCGPGSVPSPGPSMTPLAAAPSAAAPAAASVRASPVAPTSRQRVQVLSVTDGDTIRVSIDGRSTPVRYIGIDTPETVDPRQSAGCFGKEASDANKRLVEGKMVELEKDVSETDRFDRLLRYVYVEIAGRGLVMVNEELVRGGFAKSTSYPPDVKYQEVFRVRESEARTAAAGLWGGACAAATPAPTVAPTVARTVAPTAAPTAAATVAPAPALSVTITTSRYGLVAASTLAGASCTAQARLPSGAISTDQDLKVAKTATASGAVSWDYGVSSRTNPGTGTHTVTCALAGVTRSNSAPFTVN